MLRVLQFLGMMAWSSLNGAFQDGASFFESPRRPDTPQERFVNEIKPETPLKDLLPTPFPAAAWNLMDNLKQVPEVGFKSPEKVIVGKNRKENQKEIHDAKARMALQIAKIQHLNKTKADAFMEAMLKERADLSGLPMRMGEACKMPREQKAPFANAANGGFERIGTNFTVTETVLSSTAVKMVDTGAAPAEKILTTLSLDHGELATIAANMQINLNGNFEKFAPLVKTLQSVSHADATKALAKVAIFSEDANTRMLAIRALKVRKDKDYEATLLAGFQYPYPEVGKRAAHALVELKRSDLLAELVKVLEQPDPREPNDSKMVREVVKINHHHNCLLCHAPATAEMVSSNVISNQPNGRAGEFLIAQVPIPNEPLPNPNQGYNQSFIHPDLAIRFDITYLRQDFSLMLPVANPSPWPELQRFDFMVRTRTLDAEEMAHFNEIKKNRPKDYRAPHQQAALGALKELTGLQAESTAAAWRKALNIKTQ